MNLITYGSRSEIQKFPLCLIPQSRSFEPPASMRANTGFTSVVRWSVPPPPEKDARALNLPLGTRDLITWHIRQFRFDMDLPGSKQKRALVRGLAN
jgi:hypothetical protein